MKKLLIIGILFLLVGCNLSNNNRINTSSKSNNVSIVQENNTSGLSLSGTSANLTPEEEKEIMNLVNDLLK